MEIQDVIIAHKELMQNELSKEELALGEIIFNNDQCQILSQSATRYEFVIDDPAKSEATECCFDCLEDGRFVPSIDKEVKEWDRISYACLLQLENEMHLLSPKQHMEHKKYTRRGMIKRVLNERRQKADKANYRIKWANNIYGDHVLTNEKGIRYSVFLRDFTSETGYSNSMDSRLNKLGTTKHIMFAFSTLKENKNLFDSLDKTFPFVELYCDPLNDYKISWYYPHQLAIDEQLLLSRFFKNSHFIEDEKATELLTFIEEARNIPHIHIRPEVIEKIEVAFETNMLVSLQKEYTPDFSPIKATLYPYQKAGVEFALFRKNAIIADEMGLGKTIQAITTAVLKKQLFGFTKTLVICPASLKEQWQKEIEKFSDEKALVIQGFPDERALQYKNTNHLFSIVNYETVMRDQIAINKAGYDFLILDEAQRAKNYETKTASSLKRLNVKHKLAITGTPIENRLIDIFSIMGILDPAFLGPLWEFSYQHCLFDPERENKINGYYNLQKLNKKLEEILIRREKRKVIEQLPNVVQIDVPVALSPLQSDYHGSYASGLAQILRKKFLTPYDLRHMQLLLANMRMVCDSTYLIDDQTNESPKLEELQHILLEKLDLPNQEAKIIIFSEWVKVHKLIGKMLRENNIGFVELNGKIPVATRGELIRKFETNPQYKVFLSTEAGGTGLNLQIANILINFELPWNPAKKNQRIGRIDRLGQESNKLTIYNLITNNSIERQIASGLLVKQSLFDGVLGDNAQTNFVDFSTKGRSQFIQQLEEFIAETESNALKEQEQESAFAEEERQAHAQPETPQPKQIDLFYEYPEQHEEPQIAAEETKSATPINAEELETVMNNGMQFLAGLFKMTTGKDMGMEGQKIEINKETGEVTMRFKLPI
ncbi:MAG: DEAD/DEAH box helicase [Bacteroidetes bacterium]|nr:DEAD/DEAH box helicase [Bacteroidota bacterium]